MATTLAACELSGYSNSSHTFLWFSLAGNGFSSSFINPSSSLKAYEKKTKCRFKWFVRIVTKFQHQSIRLWYCSSTHWWSTYCILEDSDSSFLMSYTQQQHQCQSVYILKHTSTDAVVYLCYFSMKKLSILCVRQQTLTCNLIFRSLFTLRNAHNINLKVESYSIRDCSQMT